MLLVAHNATQTLRLARVAHACSRVARVTVYMTAQNGRFDMMHSEDINLLQACLPACTAVSAFVKMCDQNHPETRITLVCTEGFFAAYASHRNSLWEFSPPSTGVRLVEEVAIEEQTLLRFRDCLNTQNQFPLVWTRSAEVPSTWQASPIARTRTVTSYAISEKTAHRLVETELGDACHGYLICMKSDEPKPVDRDIIVHSDGSDGIRLHTTIYDRAGGATEMWVLGMTNVEATVQDRVFRAEGDCVFVNDATVDGKLTTQYGGQSICAIARSYGSLQTLVDMSIIPVCRPIDAKQAHVMELRCGLLISVARVLAHDAHRLANDTAAFDFDKAFFSQHKRSWTRLQDFCERLCRETTPTMREAIIQLVECGRALVLRQATADCFETASSALAVGSLCDVHTQLMHARETFHKLSTHIEDDAIMNQLVMRLREAMVAGKRVVERFLGVHTHPLHSVVCGGCGASLSANRVALGLDAKVCCCNETILCAYCVKCQPCRGAEVERAARQLEAMQNSARAMQAAMKEEKRRADEAEAQLALEQSNFAAKIIQAEDERDKALAQLATVKKKIGGTMAKHQATRRALDQSQRELVGVDDKIAASVREALQAAAVVDASRMRLVAQKHADELLSVRDECARRVDELETRHTQKLADLQTLQAAEHDASVDALRARHATVVEAQRIKADAEHEVHLQSLRTTLETTHLVALRVLGKELDALDTRPDGELSQQEIHTLEKRLETAIDLEKTWKARYENAIGKTDATQKMYELLLEKVRLT